jgi:hypothetical protein
VVKKHAFGLGTEPQEGQGNYTGGWPWYCNSPKGWFREIIQVLSRK